MEADPTNAMLVLVNNTMRLPNNLSPMLRNHAFDIVHNLLYTNHRSRRYSDQRNCRLCGADKEDLAHLWKSCPVAKKVISLLKRSLLPRDRRQGNMIHDSTVEDFLLVTPRISQYKMCLMLCFSWAIWRARWITIGDSAPNVDSLAVFAVAKLRHFWKWRKPF